MSRESKRVACYVRVSTENQLENYSIDEQTDRLTAYCKAKDWTITKFYIDGGYSGGNTDRPALKQMLKDIKNNCFELVVVYKLDRLSRSQKDTLTLIEDEFLIHNVDFVSMNENFDTSTPFGRAMIGILSVFSQLEKDQITERFTMGRIGRAKSGYYHGGSTAPIGYDYTDGHLIINEYEAIQVREVYTKFLDGYSINAIQRTMNKKYDKWKSATSTLNVLRNITYTGKIKFNKEVYDGKQEAIIDTETFNSVQKLLGSPERENSKTAFQKTPFKANNLLSSLLVCGNCGAKFCGNHGNYVCYSRGKTDRRRIIDPTCKNKKWKIETLDSIIMKEIIKLSCDDTYFDSIMKNKNNEPIINNEGFIKRIKDIDKQIERIIDLYQLGSIPMEQITERANKLKKERESLSEKIEDNTQTKVTVPEIKNILSRAQETFENGNIPTQRILISTLVDAIEISEDKINILWSFG